MQRVLWAGVLIGLFGAGLVTLGFATAGGEMVTDSTASGPLADAGLDQTADRWTTVYLDAGGSVAPDGDITNYEWSIETPGGDSIKPSCVDCVRSTFVAAEVGVYAVSVAVTDDSNRTDTDTLYVTVEERDVPEATLDGPDSVSVGENGTFTLDGVAGEEQLWSALWQVDGAYHDSEHLGGENSVVLETNVTFDDPGVHEVTGTVDDEVGFQASDSVEVTATTDGPHFAVAVTNTSTPVFEGESLFVNATISNVGGKSATQSVWLAHDDGTVLDVLEGVSLEAGEDENVMLEWETDAGDAGAYDLGVHSEDDTDTTTATVEGSSSGEPEFLVEYLQSPPERVDPGETVQPTVRVTNNGSDEGTQAVTLVDIHGTPAASVDLTLEAGADEDVTTLSWETTESDVGVGNLSVYTEDDQASEELMVGSPPSFEVGYEGHSDFGPEEYWNDTLYYGVYVENTGDFEDTQTIEFNLTDWDWGHKTIPSDYQPIDEKELTLEAGEFELIDFAWKEAAHELAIHCDDLWFCSGDFYQFRRGYVEVTSDDDRVDRQVIPQLGPPPEERMLGFIESWRGSTLDAEVDGEGFVDAIVVSGDENNTEDFDEGSTDVAGHAYVNNTRHFIGPDGQIEGVGDNQLEKIDEVCFGFGDGVMGDISDEDIDGPDSLPYMPQNAYRCDEP